MCDEARPAFSAYTNTHEIRKQYITDIPRKAPGTKGHEMLRQDMDCSKYAEQKERHMNTFRTQRGALQDHHRVSHPFDCGILLEACISCSLGSVCLCNFHGCLDALVWGNLTNLHLPFRWNFAHIAATIQHWPVCFVLSRCGLHRSKRPRSGVDPSSRHTCSPHQRQCAMQPSELSPCQFDDGKIVDRGRGKGTSRNATGVNNPITNEWIVMPETLQHSMELERTTGRPGTTERRWRENGDVVPTHQRAPAHGCTFTAYDPIHHVPLQQPVDSAAEAFRTRQGARVWGEVGVRHQHPPQGSYDPIRCAPALLAVTPVCLAHFCHANRPRPGRG